MRERDVRTVGCSYVNSNQRQKNWGMIVDIKKNAIHFSKLLIGMFRVCNPAA